LHLTEEAEEKSTLLFIMKCIKYMDTTIPQKERHIVVVGGQNFRQRIYNLKGRDYVKIKKGHIDKGD
jgi:hypothetical protein